MSLLGSNIGDLKSTISKHAGLASANRFALFMTPPNASLLNLDIQGSIASAISGSFKFGNLINDPRDISLLCTNVNLPGRLITTLENQTIRQSQKSPNGYVQSDVTVSFLLTGDYYIKKMMDKWMNSVVDFKNYRARYQDEYTTDVVIQQLNKKSVPIYGVKLLRAYPISVSDIQLDNNLENSTHLVTVVFTYDDFEPEGAVQSAISEIKTLAGIKKLF